MTDYPLECYPLGDTRDPRSPQAPADTVPGAYASPASRTDRVVAPADISGVPGRVPSALPGAAGGSMARETALKQSKNTRKHVPSRTTSTYTNTRAPHFTIKVELFVHLPNGTQRRCIAAIDSMSTHSYALADLTTAFDSEPPEPGQGQVQRNPRCLRPAGRAIRCRTDDFWTGFVRCVIDGNRYKLDNSARGP